MPPERRAYRRYIPVETAYAALGSAYSKVGKLKDYSYGGLSFEYLDSEALNGRSSSVDVFLVDDSFHIHNLPCKVVYDMQVTREAPAAPTLQTRRCGVKFMTATNDHKNQIATFLSEYVMSPGSGR